MVKVYFLSGWQGLPDVAVQYTAMKLISSATTLAMATWMLSTIWILRYEHSFQSSGSSLWADVKNICMHKDSLSTNCAIGYALATGNFIWSQGGNHLHRPCQCILKSNGTPSRRRRSESSKSMYLSLSSYLYCLTSKVQFATDTFHHPNVSITGQMLFRFAIDLPFMLIMPELNKPCFSESASGFNLFRTLYRQLTVNCVS